MSKVICDVCGTTYPDTANQCPICGSAKNSAAQTVAGSEGETGGEYGYVKGGRFSKKNVRKRSAKGADAVRRTPSTAARTAQREEKPQSNTGLIIVVVMLLIAIVAVMVYIGILFFKDKNPSGPVDPTGTTESSPTDPTESKPTEPIRIPCTGVQTLPNIELTQVGETWQLDVVVTPEDTTDQLLFTTSDPSVAGVSAEGVITAVGAGTADITVTCGDVIFTCVVHCNIAPPTEPLPPFVMEFNTKFSDSTTGLSEVSLSKKGETWRCYKNGMSADPADVTWITDNPLVCTIENGVVTAVGTGTTKIHAQYNGTTYSCIIRCNKSVGAADAEPETEPAKPCTISHTDVTIKVGERFTLLLIDGEGNRLDVIWEANDVNVTIEGNKITGATAGRVVVSTTYEEVTYSCIIYVKE